MNNGNVAILTAHGFLGLVEIVENSQARILRKLQCGENSTLYCSLIYGDSWESLTIFGGTALGELVIWRADDGRILNRQFLHNGVIFCIDYDGVHLVSLLRFILRNQNYNYAQFRRSPAPTTVPSSSSLQMRTFKSTRRNSFLATHQEFLHVKSSITVESSLFCLQAKMPISACGVTRAI